MCQYTRKQKEKGGLEMSKIKSPLRIICRNCGQPVTFDIRLQTYRCPMCAETSGIERTRQESIRLHELHKDDLREQTVQAQVSACSGCGAKIIFPQGEVLSNCDFCGSRLVRDDAKNLGFAPDLVIPFVLTEEEAKECLHQWAADHQQTDEARMIRDSSNDIQGYYMPYEIVRGPMEVRVNRAGLSRTYRCRGFIEDTAVNCVREMNSSLLDAAAPFDLDAAVPFEYGYIAGHRALFSDISDNDIDRRVRRQVAKAYLPMVQETLDDNDIRIKVTSDKLLSASALLPVYVLKKGRLSAVVNGQTGRIAVSLKDKKKKPFRFWAVEASVYTAVITLLFSALLSFEWRYMAMFAVFFGLLFFTAMGQNRAPIAAQVIKHSEKVQAQRRGGRLFISQSGSPPPASLPVFYENLGGCEVAVEYCFLPVQRILSLVIQSFVLIFAPAIAAAGIAAVMASSNGCSVLKALAELKLVGGCIWFIFTVPAALLLAMEASRFRAYDRPYIYELKQNGGRELIGDPKARRLSVFNTYLSGSEAVAALKTKQGILWAGGAVAVFVLSVCMILEL